jgi:hypothetical protein
MDRASERVQAGALLGAAVLAVGMALPVSAAGAPVSAADGVGLFTPGLGCHPAETLVGTAGLLSRVRAGAGPSQARRRDTARARSAQSRGGRQAARRSPAPRTAEQEPRPAVLRSFYTCAAAPNLAEGTGWRLVGPLRQG